MWLYNSCLADRPIMVERSDRKTQDSKEYGRWKKEVILYILLLIE